MRRLAVVAFLLLTPSAEAAYDPDWSFQLSDNRPASAPAIVSTLTQSQGESATRRISVRYPTAFGFNPGFSVVGCTAAQEKADACPESSRIGTTRAVTLIGSFSGPVYLSEDYRVLAYLRGLG